MVVFFTYKHIEVNDNARLIEHKQKYLLKKH